MIYLVAATSPQMILRSGKSKYLSTLLKTSLPSDVRFFTSSMVLRTSFIIFSSIPKKQWRAYSFSSLFILDVPHLITKGHKLFTSTYILCNKKFGNFLIHLQMVIFISVSTVCRGLWPS